MEGHQEQENTLNQLLVGMDGESFYTHCFIQSPWYLRHGWLGSMPEQALESFTCDI